MRDSPARFAAALVILWLGGAALRITVLAVPPVVPLLHADLGLSETGIGILSSLPSLLFAVAAIPGSLLIARFGTLPTLVIGLLVNTVGTMLRGAAPNALALDLATAVTGAGIAVMQPALPALVRRWLPDRVPFGTAVYTNGLLVGEIVVVALAIPVVLPMLGDSWRWSFVFWGLPIAATALLAVLIAPRELPAPGGAPATPRLWRPDFRNPFIWRLGILLGGLNSLYFVTNHFLPDYLTETGRAALIGPSLTALNAAQLPASALLLFWSHRLAGRRSAYVLSGGAAVLSVIGIVTLPGAWVVAAAAALGFLCAFMLTIAFALPALVAAPADVPRVSAGVFTISYSIAVVVPILGGAAWDLTHEPLAGFVPIALCGLVIVLVALTSDFRPGAKRG